MMYDANDLTSPMFVHLRELVCTLGACKTKGRSKMHTLISKAQPLCLHSIIGHVANVKLKKKDTKEVHHQIDYKLTIKKVIQKVKSEFPPSFRLLEEGNFLKDSKAFVDDLYSSGAELESRIQEKCDECTSGLELWKRKTPQSYFITLGALKKITIPVKRCPSCHIAYYPDLYSNGLICLHNSLMISVDFLFDMINSIKTGSGMIETIQHRITLMARAGGLSVDDVDVSNLSIKLEKAAIAFAAVIITEEDLDNVSCYLCGACPKIVSSGMYTLVYRLDWNGLFGI